jgi:hypothetical protein
LSKSHFCHGTPTYITCGENSQKQAMSKTGDKEEKEKWYPGKFIKERRKSSISSTAPESDDRESTEGSNTDREPSTPSDQPAYPDTDTSKKSSSGWYPGKYAGRKAPSKSGSDMSRSHPGSYPIAGPLPSRTVGSVIIKVTGAKYMSATRPGFEVLYAIYVVFLMVAAGLGGKSTSKF